MPSLDPSLTFSLPLPAGWLRAHGFRALDAANLPRPLAVFASEEQDAAVGVSATALPFEVDLLDWCRFRCVSSGWVVLAADAVALAAGSGARVLSRRGRFMRHDTAVLHRGRAVVTHVVASESAWISGAASWCTIGERLRLERPGSGTRIERHQAVRVGDAELAFDLPASWRVQGWVRSGASVSIDVEPAIGVSQRVALRLRARTVAPAPWSIAQRRADLRLELDRRGFTPRAEAGEDRPRPPVRAAIPGWLGGTVLWVDGPRQRPFEARLWHCNVAGYEVDALLVVGWHPECVLDGMRGIRALELVFSTLQSTSDRAPASRRPGAR